MAPNSEEDSQIGFSNKQGWGMEFADKEPLRPPVYNPEDYASSLKKWGKKGCLGTQVPHYLSQSTGSLERISEQLGQQNKRHSPLSTKSTSSSKSGYEKQSRKEKELTLKMEKKDLKNKENTNIGLKSDSQKGFLSPFRNLSTQTGEMSLRQFLSVSELLGKLKVDLKLSFPSFVQEFVGDPIDGVTLLLELLRAVQLSQTSQLQRCPPQILRRALLDEHSCLVCLKHCLRCSDASRRLASSPAGLFTLAVCIMSSVTQSRIIALELLTKACEPQAGGHKAVSEALSTLRLRFGEPVRFRFLVGMLSSAGAIDLLATAMKFINVFVDSAPSLQQKVYIQAELEQAGFDSEILRKTLPSNSESVKVELNKWEKNYFDVEKLNNKITEVNILHEKIHLLEKRIKILQEEKGILQSLEQCLKERCSELEEVSIKTNTTVKTSQSKGFRNCGPQRNGKNAEKEESTPAEDEGISSSEQELSQDEDCVKGVSYNSNNFEQINNLKKLKTPDDPPENEPKRYFNNSCKSNMTTSCSLKNFKNMRSNKMKETNVDDGKEIISLQRDEPEEEETTIDEVIEELENIVNDAETEVYANEEKFKILNVRSSMSSAESPKEIPLEEKCLTYTKHSFILQERINFEEPEIIPAVLHPQPPKKAKSLVHIYFPGSDFDSQDRNKSEFFEDDSDTESSDSLLAATQEKKSQRKTSLKSVEASGSLNSYSSANLQSYFIEHQEFENGQYNSRLHFEERNIDEEEVKRKHLKNNCLVKKENNKKGFPEIIFQSKMPQKIQNEEETRNLNEKLNKPENSYEKPIFYRLKKNESNKVSNESSFSRTPKVVPVPVKRSQTFHITSSDSKNLNKKNEIKPKPKMGVSGLDFQRISEQKQKNEHWKSKVFEYKNYAERRLDENDVYPKRTSKIPDEEKSDDHAASRRESFSESLSVTITNRENNVGKSVFHRQSFSPINRTPSTIRSKSIEKMDEGLDSLVDIVISTEETKKPKPRSEWNPEVTKNIGPRTRRSLAESSLFHPQHAKNLNKPEEPPKPAQRTSLTRNNSSSTPLQLPIEIKLAPVQVQRQQPMIYNFGIKPAKSVDSLLGSSQSQRCPPDGSSSPVDFKTSENKYSSPAKQAKNQIFFGNPKFESSASDHKYFESNNYAPFTKETSGNSGKTVYCSDDKHSNQVLSPNQPKATTHGYKALGVKNSQTPSKPNFLLGTYQSSKNNSSKRKISGSVLQSINTFNNNSFLYRTNAFSGIYSGAKKNKSECNFSSKEKTTEISSKSSNSNGSKSEKVTDSPSGLY